MARIATAVAACMLALVAAGYAAAGPLTQIFRIDHVDGPIMLFECVGTLEDPYIVTVDEYRATVIKHDSADHLRGVVIATDSWKGTGSDGARYQGSTTLNSSGWTDADGVTHVSFVARVRAIGLAGAPDRILWQHIEGTFTADGTALTLHQNTLETICSAH